MSHVWLPYMIIPIFAGLERIPNSQLSASEDLGASPLRTSAALVRHPADRLQLLVVPGLPKASAARKAGTNGLVTTTVRLAAESRRYLRQAQHHVLDVAVVLERVDREVLAVARLPVAAVGHLGGQRDVVVDPHAAEAQGVGDPVGAGDVAGPDRGREAVPRPVGPGDSVPLAAVESTDSSTGFGGFPNQESRKGPVPCRRLGLREHRHGHPETIEAKRDSDPGEAPPGEVRSSPRRGVGASDRRRYRLTRSRSRNFWIFPVPVFGSSSTTSIRFGTLKRARRWRAKPRSSSWSSRSPSRGTTNATGTSPHCSSGAPTTATSATAGCAVSACSTSIVEMFSPPEITMSLRRSRSST